jgi:predicted nucleic acid-binding protein
MITAIDTNVLLDVLLPNVAFVAQSSQALEGCSTSGSLVICDLVYAELCLHFEAREKCDEFLADNDIRVENLSLSANFLASRAWRAYRRKGGSRIRILVDFMIGAHAQLQASQLLSRDRGFYRSQFPSLALIDPEDIRFEG